MKLRPAIAITMIAMCMASMNTWAALGGDISTVEQDRMHMKASVPLRTATEKFTVHAMTLASGTTVREYITTTGTVFAVSWRGQTVPDLRQLMGSYFDTFTSAAKSQQSQRSQLIVRQDDLVVRSGGHMRAYMGSAYVPKLLPDGVTEADIK
jgi:hypothetical protein